LSFGLRGLDAGSGSLLVADSLAGLSLDGDRVVGSGGDWEEEFAVASRAG
jgi:hypothetical protein